MSEVIFKNEHGEYRVGDRVAFVTTGYGHSVTFGKASIRGITEGGCLQLDVDDEHQEWVSADTAKPYDWEVDGWLKRINGGDEIATAGKTGRTFVIKKTPFIRKTTLQLNRVMKL
jgi:plastocyanin